MLMTVMVGVRAACLLLSASVYLASALRSGVFLARLVTSRFMQRNGKACTHRSNNILRRGVFYVYMCTLFILLYNGVYSGP
jgi:hypothetical protein